MLIWPFPPQNGATERLEWLTSVTPCRTSEHRKVMRNIPRVSQAYSYQLTPDAAEIAVQLCSDVGAAEALVPQWLEAANVQGVEAGAEGVFVESSHLTLFKEGSRALVIGMNNHFEAVDVLAINENDIDLSEPFNITTSPILRSYSRAQIVPMRPMFFGHLDIEQQGGELITAHASFNAVAPQIVPSSSLYPSYQGRPLINRPIEISQHENIAVERSVIRDDSPSGVIFQVPEFHYESKAHGFNFSASDISELMRFKAFLYAQKGRYGELWLPQWLNGFTVAADIGRNDASIVFVGSDWGDFAYLGHIWIQLEGGTTHCAEITGWEREDMTTQRATLAQKMGANINAGSVRMCSRLVLSRFNADAIDIKQSKRGFFAAIPTAEIPS